MKYHSPLNVRHLQASETAQQVSMPTTKTNSPGSIPGTHRAEGENQLLQVILLTPHVYHVHEWAPTDTHIHKIKCNLKKNLKDTQDSQIHRDKKKNIAVARGLGDEKIRS